MRQQGYRSIITWLRFVSRFIDRYYLCKLVGKTLSVIQRLYRSAKYGAITCLIIFFVQSFAWSCLFAFISAILDWVRSLRHVIFHTSSTFFFVVVANSLSCRVLVSQLLSTRAAPRAFCPIAVVLAVPCSGLLCDSPALHCLNIKVSMMQRMQSFLLLLHNFRITNKFDHSGQS